MKIVFQYLLIVLLDVLLIGGWLLQMDIRSAGGGGLGIIILVPGAFLLNAGLAVILKLFKNNLYKIFIFNAIISPVIMFCLFLTLMDRTVSRQEECWMFVYQDTTFFLYRAKETGVARMMFTTGGFHLGEKETAEQSYSDGYIDEQGEHLNCLFVEDHFVIQHDSIIGFKGRSIPVRKIEFFRYRGRSF